MTTPKITSATHEGRCTITLADPDHRNVLSNQLCAEFVAAVDAANEDPSVRVIVVTNESHVFCAGADLSERSSGADDASTTVELADLFGAIRRSPKPFVGRIAGHAIAGGTGLAAAMDISVCINEAKFGFSEVRIGVAPAIISAICLPKMSAADASVAFLRANRFLGPEAVRLGLINYSVDPSALDTTVDGIVDDLLEGSPAGLAGAKSLLAQVPGMEFEPALTWTAELSTSLFDGAEAQEGMAAFLAKRPPSWSPRSS